MQYEFALKNWFMFIWESHRNSGFAGSYKIVRILHSSDLAHNLIVIFNRWSVVTKKTYVVFSREAIVDSSNFLKPRKKSTSHLLILQTIREHDGLSRYAIWFNLLPYLYHVIRIFIFWTLRYTVISYLKPKRQCSFFSHWFRKRIWISNELLRWNFLRLAK